MVILKNNQMLSLWWNNLFWGSINALKYSSVCTRKYVIVVVV